LQRVLLNDLSGIVGTKEETRKFGTPRAEFRDKTCDGVTYDSDDQFFEKKLASSLVIRDIKAISLGFYVRN